MQNDDFTEESARADFEDFRKTGQLTPCQMLPPSFLFHRVWFDEPVYAVNDTYVVADACLHCPLRRQCEALGENEPYGVWGGISRYGGVYRRNICSGDLPYA